MTCTEFLNELSTYLDGETAATIRAELEQHFAKCRKCFVVMDTCRRTISLYQDQEVRQLPTSLHSRLMNELQKACKSHKARQK